MQRIFSAINQALGKTVLLLGLIGLLSISSLLIFPIQSSLAANSKSLISQEKVTNQNTADHNAGLGNREDAYEKAVEVVEDPKGLEKVYEENLDEYKGTEGNNGIVEAAKDLVENVTGQK